MKRIKQICLLLFAIALFPMHQLASGQGGPVSPVEQLHRLDALPTFKGSSTIGSVSSYDRTGGNDDGFNGTYSFIRKEANGLVIADLKGPGVITRIWTPTPTDDVVEFYFDGEAVPRISVKFRDIFSGKQFPFLAPVSGIGAGGFYSYVPLPYRQSCKVLVKAERVEFYQINFATYPPDSDIKTYSAAPPVEFRENLEKARRLFAAYGTELDTQLLVANNGKLNTRTFDGNLAAGKTLTIFESRSAGRIVGLKLGPAQAFEGKERDLTIKIYYDGEIDPAISVPVGDFFGYAWGEPATRSLLLGTSAGTNYIYLPMPFDKSVRVELVSEGTRGAIDVHAEVLFTNVGRRKDEGRLYALWRRENLTAEGKPFTFLETGGGRGHMVGVILQAQGTQPGSIPEFFEGDDETTIDGEVAIHGTGSEDFFNGGWYDVPGRWESRVSLPLSGSLDFKRHLARTGGYRFMLTDAYAYRRNILSTIEHGPAGNKFPTDYVSVAFFYSENRPTAHLALPKLAERKVTDPTRVVFTPGWTTPIHAFSWSNAILLKKDEKVGGENLRHLSLKAEGREVFGPHYISFICEMPASGRYKVLIQPITGADQGIVQLFHNEVGLGQAADLYSAERRKGPEIPMGELDLLEGDNRVMFKMVGKNQNSTGLGFDLYRIIFEKVK
jgi:hypothetical protein